MSRRKKKSSEVQDAAVADDLRSALSDLSFIEVLDSGIIADRVRVLMRVHDDSSWFPVLKLILREEKRQNESESPWSIHVCRQFMLRPDNDEVLGFAWNFVLRSSDLRGAVDDVRRVIDVAKSAITFEPEPKQPRLGGVVPASRRSKISKKAVERLRGELKEYPLMANPNRNMPDVDLFAPSGKRKGAHLIGGN